MLKLRLDRARIDITAAMVFVFAAIVVAANIQLGRFSAGFWIALLAALIAFLISSNRRLPVAAVAGFAAIRFAVALVLHPSWSFLVGLVVSGVASFLIITPGEPKTWKG